MFIKVDELGGCHDRRIALHKIYAWAPKRAESFKVVAIQRYRYGNSVGDLRRHCFRVYVEYYSCLGGDYLIKQDEWNWSAYCLHRQRFPVHRTRSSLKRMQESRLAAQ